MWPREGQMVNDMTGLFFFLAWGHVALIKPALPITSCPYTKRAQEGEVDAES